MTDISICIPSIKTTAELSDQIIDIAKNTFDSSYRNYELVTVCKKQSAAKNRNECIEKAKYNLIIMMDDDIFGFFPEWASLLIKPLIENPDKYNIISARLLHENLEIAPALGDCGSKEIKEKYQKAIHTEKTQLNIVCSACIAFYKSGIIFDENYQGGGAYEDSDFAMAYSEIFYNRINILNNECKLIHKMEAKNRGDGRSYWKHNRDYFNKKWKIKERFGVIA